MRKVLFICCFISCSFFAGAQIAKVEHFNAHTTHATELFNLFKTKFQLPVIYDYQEFGNFSSGGLWLGNITLEFVNYQGLNTGITLFKGIALEPVQHADTILRMLDEFSVAHSNPVPARFTVDNVEKTYWTNIGLKDLSADDIRVFICDYTDRAFVNTPKKAARKTFMEDEGGPLGIMGLKKIIIGSANIEKALHAWISIPGAKKTGANHFSFFDGPEIVVEKAEKDGIKEIQVQVRSIEVASKFLTENNMLSMENTTTLIDPGKLYGLRIILQQ
jgi:hypothetical protein